MAMAHQLARPWNVTAGGYGFRTDDRVTRLEQALQTRHVSLNLSAREPMMAVFGNIYIVRRAGKFFRVGKVLL